MRARQFQLPLPSSKFPYQRFNRSVEEQEGHSPMMARHSIIATQNIGIEKMFRASLLDLSTRTDIVL